MQLPWSTLVLISPPWLTCYNWTTSSLVLVLRRQLTMLSMRLLMLSQRGS